MVGAAVSSAIAPPCGRNRLHGRLARGARAHDEPRLGRRTLPNLRAGSFCLEAASPPQEFRQHGIPGARSTEHHAERHREAETRFMEGLRRQSAHGMSEHDNAGRGRPTIRDIAQRAGVSKSLVSLVMRGEPRVREEKRSRVLAAAEELGYPTNAATRAMSSTQSMTVGILISDLRDPMLVDIVASVEEVLHDSGLGTVLTGAIVPSSGPTGHRIFSKAIGALRALRVDAILVVGSVLDAETLIDSAGNVPMVVAA